MNNAKQAFLFLSHLSSPTVIKEFENIRLSTQNMGDAFFLYDAAGNIIPEKIKKLSPYYYSRECLSSLGYPTIGQNIIPGHAHFPVFRFFLDKPHYDYYWAIEYDVKFSGQWRYFFESFLGIDADFLSCHIHPYQDEPGWPWWELNHPRESIPLPERICSFNPIYRISNSALSFLHQTFISGWRGHHEVALPTLLHHNQFTIRDISGSSKFTVPDMDNKFYTRGTMRYRPAFWLYGSEKNKLYHPVKPLTKTLYDNILFDGSVLLRRLNFAGH